MYEDYYGFTEKPFSLTPDPRFLYLSESHGRAFDLLQYAIRRREGFVVVTGDIGTGKTTLCRAVLDRLDPRTFTALVLNPFLSEDDLITLILQEFGVVSREEVKRGRLAGVSKQELIDTLNDFLLSTLALGGRAILIIDEAQNLPAQVLEQVRILSNLETDKEKLLQVVLVGQLNLQAILRSPGMRQLDQRVSLRYQLNPLSREETAGYVAHRLHVAGGNGAVSFAPRALDLVHRLSGGTPRLINLICDRALLGGYGARVCRIPPEAVTRAAETLDVRPRRSRLVSRVRRMASAVVTGGVASVLLGATAAGVARDVGWRPAVGATAVDPPAAPPLGAGTAAARQRPAYAVLVGSYDDAWSATSVRQRLEVMGYRTYQVGAGSAVQQVLVGRFSTETQARAEEARLHGTPGFEAVRLVTVSDEFSRPDLPQDRHP